MGDKTGIEWTDATWNPIRGCSRVSDGCRHCYAEVQAARIIRMDRGRGVPEGEGAYDGLLAKGGQWNGQITEVESVLDQPLRWSKPRRIFVNSMSDLFHEAVPLETLDRIFAVMLACAVFSNRKHTFQVLTKRAAGMRDYFASRTPGEHLQAWAIAGDKWISCDEPDLLFSDYVFSKCAYDWDENCENSSGSEFRAWGYTNKLFPLPNVWLGVSVEDQDTARERIAPLLETPAAVRWLSMEPLLGPVSLRWLAAWPENAPYTAENPAGLGVTDHLDGLRRLDWVVVGGESGKHARPMLPAWAAKLRDECAAAGVPFLFKQWGEWAPGEQVDRHSPSVPVAALVDGQWQFGKERPACAGDSVENKPDLYRIGKHSAGRLLEGQEHNGYPKSLGERL